MISLHAISLVCGLGWDDEVWKKALLSVLSNNSITSFVTSRSISLHGFSYQLFVTVVETPNLHNRKATDSRMGIVLLF